MSECQGSYTKPSIIYLVHLRELDIKTFYSCEACCVLPLNFDIRQLPFQNTQQFCVYRGHVFASPFAECSHSLRSLCTACNKTIIDLLFDYHNDIVHFEIMALACQWHSSCSSSYISKPFFIYYTLGIFVLQLPPYHQSTTIPLRLQYTLPSHWLMERSWLKGLIWVANGEHRITYIILRSMSLRIVLVMII